MSSAEVRLRLLLRWEAAAASSWCAGGEVVSSVPLRRDERTWPGADEVIGNGREGWGRGGRQYYMMYSGSQSRTLL